MDDGDKQQILVRERNMVKEYVLYTSNPAPQAFNAKRSLNLWPSYLTDSLLVPRWQSKSGRRESE